jgi:dolichyl-phosphate-mannose-protein mannosyltransferase
VTDSAAESNTEPRVVSKEEKVEYRDQHGNILNAEQVKELEGKVEFETKYETRTRVVDDQGKEIPSAGVAPPHPDVEGVDKETVKADAKDDTVKDAAASRDGEREAEDAKARPASEGKEATGKDEL